MKPWERKLQPGYIVNETKSYKYDKKKKSKCLNTDYEVILEKHLGDTIEEAAEIKADLYKKNIKLSEEHDIKRIQDKKYITVKEFAEIYNMSRTSQQNARGRIHDPLPYHQKMEGGKITYVVDEVEKWLANQHK